MTRSIKLALAAGLFSLAGFAMPVITNGDFSGGDSGFTNDHTYVGNGAQGAGNSGCASNTAMFPEDTYAVGTNGNTCHSSWLTFGDNTTGTGNMLLVNGTDAPGNTIAWQQNVANWEVSHSYTLMAAVRNLFTSGPASLQFFVDGTAIGSFLTLNSSGAVGGWQNLMANCGPGAPCATAGSHVVSIRNTAAFAFGNDFAIDDIKITDNGFVEIPEPTTSALMAAGLIGLALIRRKQQ